MAIQCLIVVGLYAIIQASYYNLTQDKPRWWVLVDIVFQVMILFIVLGGVKWLF